MKQESRQEPPNDASLGEDAGSIQELYADAMRIEANLYTATLTFGNLRREAAPINHVKVRVSPHMLKAISLLTSKHVREFESKTGGPILLPNDLVHKWGLEEEIR